MQGFEPGFAEAQSKPRDIPTPEPHWAFYPAAFQMRQVRARAPVGLPTLHTRCEPSKPRDMQGSPPHARSGKPSKPRDIQGPPPVLAESQTKQAGRYSRP